MKRGVLVVLAVGVMVFLLVGCGGGGAGPSETYNLVLTWSGDGGPFRLPCGVAIGPLAGNVWVTDTINGTVGEFNPSDGTSISHAGGLNSPHGIALGIGGVYVAEAGMADDIRWVDEHGVGHITPGFNDPWGVAVDSTGNVYIADTGNNQIKVYDQDLTVLIHVWGRPGSGDGEFTGPCGIAVDSSGYVYVVDRGNSRVQKFTSDGTLITKWGSHGSAPGQFNLPMGIAVDSAGNVYVADTGNNRVQKFTSGGRFITQFGSSDLINPLGIAVHPSGKVYVADPGHTRIAVFEKR